MLERLLLGVGAGRGRLALPQLVVLGEAAGRRSGELRLQLDAARAGDRAAGRGGLERDPAEAFHAGDEDRRFVQELRSAGGVAGGAQANARREIARDRRPPDQRARPEEHDLPIRQLAHRVQHAAGDLAFVRAQLDHDPPSFRGR